MNIFDFKKKKDLNDKITMITCYDYTFAKIINQSQIDCVLVGDSLAMVMHGYEGTLNATVELMRIHTAAVARGMPDKFIIGDMPFLSYRKDLKTSLESAQALMCAGAHAVKLEGAMGNLETVRHFVDSGIPVMGHLGLTPQSVHQLGGFKVQGRGELAAKRTREQALQLQQAGCFALVLEYVPRTLAANITNDLSIPTIGIGAGPEVDGQVLVLQDMLGMIPDFSLKCAQKFMTGYEQILDACNQYDAAVKAVDFPAAQHCFTDEVAS